MYAKLSQEIKDLKDLFVRLHSPSPSPAVIQDIDPGAAEFTPRRPATSVPRRPATSVPPRLTTPVHPSPITPPRTPFTDITNTPPRDVVARIASDPSWQRMPHAKGAQKLGLKILDTLFTDEELKVSSPSGFRGLAVLCPDKMDLIKNAIHRVYGGPSFEFCWSKCLTSIAAKCKSVRSRAGF